MKKQFFFASLTCYIIGSFVPAYAGERTTVTENPRGGQTTVITDGQGTRSIDNRTGQNVYSSGGDRHNEQVQKSMEPGGRIIKDEKR